MYQYHNRPVGGLNTSVTPVFYQSVILSQESYDALKTRVEAILEALGFHSDLVLPPQATLMYSYHITSSLWSYIQYEKGGTRYDLELNEIHRLPYPIEVTPDQYDWEIFKDDFDEEFLVLTMDNDYMYKVHENLLEKKGCIWPFETFKPQIKILRNKGEGLPDIHSLEKLDIDLYFDKERVQILGEYHRIPR